MEPSTSWARSQKWTTRRDVPSLNYQMLFSINCINCLWRFRPTNWFRQMNAFHDSLSLSDENWEDFPWCCATTTSTNILVALSWAFLHFSDKRLGDQFTRCNELLSTDGERERDLGFLQMTHVSVCGVSLCDTSVSWRFPMDWLLAQTIEILVNT